MQSVTHPIGIDLGTTNSVIATASQGEFQVLENARGDRKTPSVVSYDGSSKDVYVGQEAKNQAVNKPMQTIESIKRHMGDEKFLLGDESYRPEKISALILKKLVQDAEKHLLDPITHAVITVPAYFSEKEKKATKKAAKIADIKVDRIINEPTAACLAYGLQSNSEKTVFVYDLGGGTFDCSLVNISKDIIDVIGVDGATDIGGDDYDTLMVTWLIDQIADAHGAQPDISQPEVDARMREEVQQVKHSLSNRTTETIVLPHLPLENGAVVNVEQDIDRDTLAGLVTGPTEETLNISGSLLSRENMTTDDVDDILLVGGSTRMPLIREAISDFFGQQPETGVNPDHVVALGATAQACIIHDKPFPSPSTTNAIPAVNHTNNQQLMSDDSDTILLDVLPMGIGVKAKERESGDEFYLPLLQKGESIPVRTQTNIVPHEDYQTHTTFEIYQGNSKCLAENEKLDSFTLGPYPPKKRENQEHLIKIFVDVDGIVHVEAIDENYDAREDIEVEADHALSDDDIEEMKSDLPTVRN